MRKWIAGGVLAVSVVGMGSTAFAGEVTGSGKGGPNGDGTPGATIGIFAGEGAHSICAFSGQNDTPNDPVEGGRVQSYGQIPKAFRPTPGTEEHPGQACNGHSGIVAQVSGGSGGPTP